MPKTYAKRFNITLPQQLLDRLELYQENTGMLRSHVVQVALRHWLDVQNVPQRADITEPPPEKPTIQWDPYRTFKDQLKPNATQQDMIDLLNAQDKFLRSR